mmetsp:Transcript_32279/g.93236  ORF Transcript_32279/g.93236 Transcript_32279/m.93236 type:complete len:204 (-) Transcript_32279:115-726(-)
MDRLLEWRAPRRPQGRGRLPGALGPSSGLREGWCDRPNVASDGLRRPAPRGRADPGHLPVLDGGGRLAVYVARGRWPHAGLCLGPGRQPDLHRDRVLGWQGLVGDRQERRRLSGQAEQSKLHVAGPRRLSGDRRAPRRRPLAAAEALLRGAGGHRLRAGLGDGLRRRWQAWQLGLHQDRPHFNRQLCERGHRVGSCRFAVSRT